MLFCVNTTLKKPLGSLGEHSSQEKHRGMRKGNGQGLQVVPEISVHVDGTGDLQYEEGLSQVNVCLCSGRDIGVQQKADGKA